MGEEASTTKVVLIWTAPAEDADSVTGYEVLRAVGQGDLATLAADTGSTTNTYVDATATEAGETYTYRVKAIRGEDRSQASGQAQVQLPHDAVDLAPSNLTAEKVDGGINLSWTAPAEDADSVTGYEILRAVGEGELASLAADTGSTDTTYSDTTATDAEETYAYRVKAIRGQAKSQGSNKVIEAPEPPATPENLAPSGLVFVILEDGVALTWDAPAADADGVTGYRVLRRLPNQGENEWLVWEWDTGSTETAYKDGYAQTLGEYYMYRVRALRGDEYSKMSNRVDVRRPEAAPETTAWAPSNLEALVYAEVTLGEEGVTTQVKLTWDAPSDGTEWIRGYEVQRATCDGGFATLVSDTGSTATAYADADAEAGESYTYRVRARRPQGLSLWSNSWAVLLPGGTGEGACGTAAGPGVEEDLRFAASMHDTTVLVKNTGKTVDTTPTLYSVTPKRAQGFRTGTNADGYTLGSIGVRFATIDNTADAGDVLTVTLNAASGGDPGSVLCTLTDPASFTANAVNTFDAPGTCPTLAARTTYYVHIERTSFGTDDIHVYRTGNTGQDTGGQMGWFVLNDSRTLSGGTTWLGANSAPHLIDVRGVVIPGGVPEPTLVKNIGQDPDNYFAQDLTATANRRAQVFTTGANAGGYTLDSIGIDFDTIADTSMAGSRLTVTLNADSSGDPGSALCTLTDPTTFTARTVNTFAAPATCPTLAASTDYFVLIHRVNTTGGTISVRATTDFGEDAGDAAGWSIGNRRHSRISAFWISASGPLLIEVRGALAPVVLGTPLVKNTGQSVGTALALSANVPKRAQAFTTGANTVGYTLGSIGFHFGDIADTSTAGGELTVTLNKDDNGDPGDALCTLNDPESFTLNAVNTFDAPTTGTDPCPTLAANTAYFVVIERVTITTSIALTVTTSTNEDTGGSAGWSIGNERKFFLSGSWDETASESYQIEVRGAAGVVTLPPPPVVLEPGQGVVVVKNTGQTADPTAQTLIANRPRLAQQFTTGTSAAGYRLGSISVDFDSIGTTSTAGSQLKVTLNDELKNLDNDGIGPGDVLCTLSDPATFTGSGVHTFDAPETCPTLEPGRPYFAVIHRSAFSGGTISLKVTTSADEDSGGAAGWSIRDRRHWFPDGLIYGSTDSESHLIEVSAAAVVFDEQDPVNKHFNTLHAAGNLLPHGLWSDGDTMWVVGAPKWWVVGAPDAKIYAYDMATKAHKPTEDFNDLATGNAAPRGIWSDGDTMWVSDQDATKVFAYDMTTKARVKAKEFAVPDRLPISQGGSSVTRDADFQGIWSDGTGIMWLVSESNRSVYAYSIATGNPVSKENFIIGRPYLRDANGIWGDAQSIWVTNPGVNSSTISAFWRFAKAAQPGRDIQLDPGNADPIGLWSDGTTMWVTDHSNVKIYAYPLPAAESPLTFKDRLSVERVTDTTAIVALDLRGLPFAGERKAVSISINFGGATIYAHPDAGTARFMLRGLEAETQYTVSGKFDVQPSHHLGRVIFRTDYARLAGIGTSGLTHTEATVTVSLAHADVDKRCCIPYWVSRDESELVYTYYLRHKPSDGSDWSDPVELSFSGSGSTTDARLTGLDPGTAYDVEVGEDPTFMPPTASVASYAGTLTVGDDGFDTYTGYSPDGLGGFVDPFGSMSPDPTFEVGGVERSITELSVFLYGGDDGNTPSLNLTFDAHLPFVSGELATGFTLTVGTTVYNSTDAERYGDGNGYEWVPAPNWSSGDMVSVEIGFTWRPCPSGKAPRWRCSAPSPPPPCRGRWPSRRR